MKLTFIKDAPSSGEITIDKFFQFVVAGDKSSDGLHQIEMFNAVCFSAEKNLFDAKLDCNFDPKPYSDKSIKTDIEFKDKVEYLNEVEIVKQFWGKESYSSSNREDFIKRLNIEFNFNESQQSDLVEDVELIYNTLNKNLPVIIREDKKKIDAFILLPFKAVGTKSNNVQLKSVTALKKLKLLHAHASVGFWFHNSYKIKLQSRSQNELFKVDVNFKNELIKSPDFKIYYQVNSDVELKRGKVSLSDSTVEALDSEIIGIYSQPNMNYFEDWINFGIYSSSLFSLKNTAPVNKKIEEGISLIESELELKDVAAEKKKEMNIFILSIFISALMAMGLDATRLSDVQFQNYFPEIPFFSDAFIWLLICFGILSKYFYITKNNFFKQRYIKAVKLLSTIVVFWIFCCFFIDARILINLDFEGINNFYIIKLGNWIQLAPVLDILLTAYLFFSMLFLRSYAKHKNNDKYDYLLRAGKSIFGVT